MTNPWDAVMAAVTKLGDRVDATPSVREATVAATEPLSVLFDTDSVPTLVTGSLQGVAVGQRVLTVRLKRYVWILGAKGNLQIATMAEVQALTDPSKLVTPATLKSVLKPIQGQIPTSVVVGSGSATVAADGTVAVVGVSSVSLNGIFDGLGADEYEMTVRSRYTNTGGGNETLLRFRSNNVDNTAGAYDYGYINSDGNAAPSAGGSNGQSTMAYIAGSSPASNGWCLAVSRISRPMKNDVKLCSSRIIARSNTAVTYRRMVGSGLCGTQSAHDGITLITTAGTFDATIKVVKIA